MENEFQRLSGEVESFADMLRGLSGQLSGEGSEEVPHAETIDFDRLCGLLDDIRERLLTAQRLDNETATTRQWLIGRIESLRRGRQALLNERPIGDLPSSLHAAPVAELIRRFEDESAAFRTTATPGAVNSRRTRPDYNAFKS